MTDYGTVINQSCHVKDSKITITDKDSGKKIEISLDNILGVEINYETSRIIGYVIVNDLYGFFSNIKAGPNIEVQLYINDIQDTKTTRTFYVKSQIAKKEQNQASIRLDIQDKVSYTLDNLFISKSYNSTKLNDILSEYLDKYAKETIQTDKLKLDITSTKNTRELYSVNQTKSFLDFIQDDLEREGYFLYQTHDSIILKSYKDLVPSKLPENSNNYVQKTDNQYYLYRILEHRNLNDKKINKIEPKTECMVYDPKTKKFIHYKQNLEEMGDDLLIGNSSKPKSQETQGIRYITREYLDDSSLYADTFKRYIRDSQLEAVVPGSIKNSNLYTKINIKLSGNINVKESMDKGDQRISGKYVITKVVYKLIGGNAFTQKLTLSRLDSGEVS